MLVRINKGRKTGYWVFVIMVMLFLTAFSSPDAEMMKYISLILLPHLVLMATFHHMILYLLIMVQHRNMIVVEDNAQAGVIVCDHTMTPQNFLTNSVTEIFTGKTAVPGILILI